MKGLRLQKLKLKGLMAKSILNPNIRAFKGRASGQESDNFSVVTCDKMSNITDDNHLLSSMYLYI